MIAEGERVPDFELRDEDSEPFTQADLEGQTSVLVFYPFAFSPVCTDQLNLYEEMLDRFEEQGATLYAISTDSTWAQKAFKEKLGVSIAQLSDFEPKGEVSRAFGAYFEPDGMTNCALVIVGFDGVVRWSHLADSPGDLPGVGLIFDGLAASPVS